MFYSQPLVWNGRPLRPILDHKNGNRLDNSPENLRYLCPPCESQLETRGGGNKGRLSLTTETSYTLKSRDGREHHHVIIPAGRIRIGDEARAELIQAPKKQ
jgi:hypothetical protein